MTVPAVSTTDRHLVLLDQLARRTEELRTSAGWQEWIRFASRFRSYSVRNQLLISLQCPEATRVAGYRAWTALGRQVDRGERGIAIFAPRTRWEENEAGERVSVVSGYRIVHVFDVSQTSGAPLPQLVMPDVEGSSDAVFGALLAAASSEELEVRREVQSPDWDGPKGWISYEHRTITLIDYGQGLGNMTRTMLHELAHWADPAAGHSRSSDLEPVLEVVAESAAMITGTSLLGLEILEASAFYVSHWSQAFDGLDGDFMSQLAEHSLRVASRLDAILKPHVDLAIVGVERDSIS